MMELVNYDEKAKTCTIAFDDAEFLDIHAVVSSVLSTYKQQDPLIIGVQRDRLKEVMGRLHEILKQVNASALRK